MDFYPLGLPSTSLTFCSTVSHYIVLHQLDHLGLGYNDVVSFNSEVPPFSNI